MTTVTIQGTREMVDRTIISLAKTYYVKIIKEATPVRNTMVEAIIEMREV